MKTQSALTLALGSALFALSLPASAAETPFATQSLSQGYQVAQADQSAPKAGEAKCGADKAKDKLNSKKADGKCGEAKCGADKKAAKPASKKTDGKCGEAKCGADKKAQPHADKKADGQCGASK